MKRIFCYNDKFDSKQSTTKINVIFFQPKEGKIECVVGHCSAYMQQFADYYKNQLLKYNFKQDYYALKDILIIPSKLKLRECFGVITSSKKSFHQVISAFDGKPLRELPALYSDIENIASTPAWSHRTRNYDGNRQRPAVLSKIKIKDNHIHLTGDSVNIAISIADLIAFRGRAEAHRQAKEHSKALYGVLRDDVITLDGDQVLFDLCQRCITLDYHKELTVNKFAQLIANDDLPHQDVLQLMANKNSTFSKLLNKTLGYSIVFEKSNFYIQFPDWIVKCKPDYLLEA